MQNTGLNDRSTQGTYALLMHLGLIPSLFLFYGLLSILYAGAIHYFLKSKDQQAVRHWSLGSLIWGSAILVTVFRQDIPLLVSYFLANAVAFIACVELNRALQVLTQPKSILRSPPRWLDLALVAVYAGLLYALDRWTPTAFRELAKTCFVSGVMVIVALQGAHYCVQIGRTWQLQIAHNFAYLYVLVGGLWLARIIASIAFQTTHAFDPAIVNIVIWVLIFITGVVKYMVFPLLLQKKSERDEHTRLRTTLAKANKTVTSGALSASIAHELNQPLTVMRLSGEIMLKKLEEEHADTPTRNAELRAMLQDILTENDRAAKIISSLRAIFTQSPTTTAEVNLAQQIRKTTELLRKDFDNAHIQLELQLAEQLYVHVSEDEFHQVLVNLLFNSIQALQQVGHATEKRIAIASYLTDAKVKITISDNGPGVPKDVQDQLFNILNTTKDSGMGIGLWLSQYIIERHRGSIQYMPSRLGGASFTITLPAVVRQP